MTNIDTPAVNALYGSLDELFTRLDTLATPAVDVWADSCIGVEVTGGITGSAIRRLWSDTFGPLGDDEADVVALALSGDPYPAREAAREALTEAYMGLVKRIASVHTRREDSDDIRQAAVEGLWKGFHAFDPARHARPVATVQRSILSTLNDAHAARFGMNVPEAHRLAYTKARAEAARLALTDPRNLDDLAAELAPEFGLSTVDYWHVYRVATLGDIDAPFLMPDWVAQVQPFQTEQRPLVEQPDAPSVAETELIAGLLDRLDGREREVIGRRFGVDGHPTHTEDEAAESLSLTPRRVRQIQAAALAKLREPAPALRG